MVIAIMGLIVSMVQFTFSGKRPEDALEKSSYHFAQLFESAATYGLLNNIELGLSVNKSSYRFVGYDGVKWSDIPNQDWLGEQTLPEGVAITLSLDDLPIETPLLFDSSVFSGQDDDSGYLSFDSIEKEKQADAEKLILPQVFILSGGDITPFSLTFHFNDEVTRVRDVSELAYRVTGIYSTPLLIEGPVLDE